MSAKQKQGMAALEEFLQEKYVEHYDKLSDDKNKIAELSNIYPEYFYDPRTDGFGNVNYVADSDGHALYLINKSELPKEIKDGLVGGDCGLNKEGSERYMEYLNLNDVYGVTSNLTVYYSNANGELYGIASKDEFDDDTTSRPVLDANSPLAGLLKSDGTDLTVADTQSIKNLTIDNTSGITSLKDLYVLGSLESLTLKDLKLDNIDGIQNALNLNYVYSDGSVIGNYNSLANVKKLTYLYFKNIDDTELTNICDGIKNANYPNLQYFGVVGNTSWLSSTDSRYVLTKSTKSITNLTPLSTLSSCCVENIKYLNFTANKIGDTEKEDGTKVYALENLKNFKSIYLLRIEGNNLTSLKGLEDKESLKYLWACYNKLGENEKYNKEGQTDEEKGKDSSNSLCALSNNTTLIFLQLEGNPQLKWVSYLSGCTGLTNLYFGDGTDLKNHCVNMVDSEVKTLRIIFNNCGTNKSYPGKYWLALLDESDMNLNVNLANETITVEQFQTLKLYTNIKYLNLENVLIVNGDDIITSKDEINTLATSVLKSITNLQYINFNTSSGKSFYNWNSLEFIKGSSSEDSKDDICLVNLLANNTKLSTKEEKNANSFITYDNGLILLNSKRADDSGNYFDKLKVLRISENHVKLSEINSCVVHLEKNCGFDGFTRTYYGLSSDNKDIIESISECDGLTKCEFYLMRGDKDWVIDLRNQTGTLTEFRIVGGWAFRGVVYLPSSVDYIMFIGTDYGYVDLAELNNFKIDFSWGSEDSVVNTLATLKVENKIKDLTVGNNSIKDLSWLKKVYDKRSENNLKIDIFRFTKIETKTQNFSNLSGLEYVDGLQEIWFGKNASSSLKDISALQFNAETIKSISLPGNSISDISILSNFTNLTYLDLENNSLAPYIEINNETGKTKWITITEICNRMRLNAGNGKVTLKLKGNSAITDWTGYTKDISKWAAGSSYGN